MERAGQLNQTIKERPSPTLFVGGGYGATAVAVLDSRQSMEKPTERNGI